jgi:hypothetical protein
MKGLKVLIALSLVTVAVVGTTTQANARPRGRAHTQVLVTHDGRRYANPGYAYGPQYDVWGRLVGSDPNHPIFAPGAENLQWNTPNNFPPYTNGY